MTGLACLFLAGVLAISLLLTGVVRRFALRRGMLDRPNQRSSHTVPTPRGGGVAIVVSFSAAMAVLWSMGLADTALVLALLVGGGAVAIVGYLDDRGSLSVKLRILVHFVAAIVAVAILGGMPALDWGGQRIDPGLLGDVFAVVGIVWMLNLFNFMDGIDGIAASQAAFMGAAGAALIALGGASGAQAMPAAALAAATLGFLCWNWPPARIFMGDVGSGYLGFVTSLLALAAMRTNPVMLYVWLILSGTFFVDATVTLVRRLLQGQRIYEAHRSHAYQWLARRWGRHLLVTLTYSVVNVLWMLPWAWFALRSPPNVSSITTVALLPAALAALACGAGRSEEVRA